MISRRTFLQAGTAAAAGVALGAAPTESAEALIGSQLYGWGQYYERAGKKLFEHLDEVFPALRDAGYDYAEGSLEVGRPENNLRFAEKMKAKGLKTVCIYTGGRLHEAETWEENVQALVRACEPCAAAGYQVINCNPDPGRQEKDATELARQAKALELFGRELNTMGLQLGVHNHSPEMRNQAREFHHNFRQTDPKAVGFCFDVHWVYRGGMAPMEALREYGKRIVSWHLRQSREEIWWEDLDSGDIDYKEIAREAREHRLPERYTVELALENGTKITRTVVENHRRSLEFVKRVFGV